MSSIHKAANQQGLQGGAIAPGPQDVVPQEDAGQLPPEIMALIDSLPPEQLEQILAAVEAEMQQTDESVPPQGGLPPGAVPVPPPDQMVAKQAAYKEGFFEQAKALNFTPSEANELYKRALYVMENSVQSDELLKEKKAHFNGFMERAGELNLTQAQANDLYAFGFGN